MKRNYKSGCEKRKRQKEQIEKQNGLLRKVPKLTNFYKCNSSKSVDATVDATVDLDRSDIEEGSISMPAACKEVSTDSPVSPVEEIAEGGGRPEYVQLKRSAADFNAQEEIQSSSHSSDPALWPADKKTVLNYYIHRQEIPDQNIKSNNFEASRRRSAFKDSYRFCSLKYFSITLKNGETRKRDWLIYSPSTGKVFCFFCVIFGDSIGVRQDSFTTGFCDWSHGNRAIQNHEKSKDHLMCAQCWAARLSKVGVVDTLLILQEEEEKRYWREVLKRVIECLKFLCERGLALRGDSENIDDCQNGNFLGALEFLAKFDPFLAKHLETRGNPGYGRISYLSSTTYEEIVLLMGKRVLKAITDEVNHAKYFSIIVDSSPDVSHCDQLAIILRYVSEEAVVEERFVGYETLSEHTGKFIADVILRKLESLDVHIKDARGQSYDNASNMSGMYNGVQAQLRKENKYIDYIPCAAHSLNLVGVNAVESCRSASDFFSFLQRLYNFCASSTSRWATVCSGLTSGNESKRPVTMKSLSDTRWSARANSTKVLYDNYNEIYLNLQKIYEDSNEKRCTRDEAMALLKKMKSLDTAFMTVLWHRVLERFNTTSMKLQEKSLDLSVGVKLLQSLVEYVCTLRDSFNSIEENARKLSDCVEHQYKLASVETHEGEILLTGSNQFRVENFVPVVDRLIACLNDRLAAYVSTETKFGLLARFKTMPVDDISAAAMSMCANYPLDLDKSFPEEMVHFSKFVVGDCTPSAHESLQLIRDNKLVSIFPNVEVALRIYLSLPITNCSAERAFSKMSRVKNDLRNSMGNDRLNAISLMTIERTLLRSMRFEDIVEDFATKKARKMTF